MAYTVRAGHLCGSAGYQIMLIQVSIDFKIECVNYRSSSRAGPRWRAILARTVRMHEASACANARCQGNGSVRHATFLLMHERLSSNNGHIQDQE
jgi:hypothetical protein